MTLIQKLVCYLGIHDSQSDGFNGNWCARCSARVYFNYDKQNQS